ncbi:MAG: prepilin-type N-terminal cleavage/methylation domain-containing protein [Pseudomonadota bacterium]
MGGVRKPRLSASRGTHFGHPFAWSCTRNPERGFTLLEVLVSVAILGIALTFLIQLFSGGLTCADRSGEYTQAILYAREKMGELTAKNDLSEGEDEGEFDSRYKWRAQVLRSKLMDEEDYKDLPVDAYEIDLRVLWSSGDKERQIGLEGFRVIPKSVSAALTGTE